MLAFSFWDARNRRPTVDPFADYPMDFDLLFAEALTTPMAGTSVRVASLTHLIEIKKAAGRLKDIEDAPRLAEIVGKS